MEEHEKFMQAALAEAKKAYDKDEVPVGCVIAQDGRIVARAHNTREKTQDATAHAEILCIRKACKKLGTFRLYGCVLYVTLEPCPMCAGAAINARLSGIVYGASDPKAGACGTLYNLTEDKRFNHRLTARGGVLAGECAALLSRFFSAKRKDENG
jgi:tRNA(adenine34) deaminase